MLSSCRARSNLHYQEVLNTYCEGCYNYPPNYFMLATFYIYDAEIISLKDI